MRLPDSDLQQTAAAVLPDDYVLSSNPTGDIFLVVDPKVAWSQAVVSAGGAITAPSFNASSRGAAFDAASQTSRLICMKVEITYVGAVMASAGYISASRRYDIPVTMTAAHNDCDRQVRAQDGITVYSAPIQTPRFDIYGATNVRYTYPYTVIAMSGLPASSACVKMRLLFFMEFIPKAGDLAMGERSVEPHNPGAMSAMGQLGMVATSMHTTSERATFQQNVKAVANAAYHMAQPYIPQVLGMAKDYIVNTAMRAAPALAMLTM